LLKARDVAVTNQTDKDLWLRLIFELDEAVKSAFTLSQAKDLYEQGEKAGHLCKAGFTPTQLKEAGYDVPRLLLEEGCNIAQLREFGYSITQLKEAHSYAAQGGYPTARGRWLSAALLRPIVTARSCNKQEEEGGNFKASELKKAGYSVKELREAGYSVKEFREAGYSAQELRDACYSIDELFKAGYHVQNLA